MNTINLLQYRDLIENMTLDEQSKCYEYFFDEVAVNMRLNEQENI